jgi:hypothetical protein
MATITSPATVAKRNAALTALAYLNSAVMLDPSLAVMAAAARNIIQARPVLARPGVYQAEGPQTAVATPRATLAPAPVSEASAAPPELVATMRRYASRRGAPDPLLPGLPRQAHRTVVTVQDVAADQEAPALTPGTLVQWQLAPQVRHTMHVEGGASWRATCFDPHGELIADVESAANGALALPEGSAAVTLQGLDPVRAVAGWQVDGDLLRLNRYYFAGEGCLVRIQNVLPGPTRGLGDSGPCCTQALMEMNRVRGRDGLRPGWIETVIPGGRERFAVSCRLPEGLDATALRVTASLGDRPGAVGDAPLVPVAIETEATVTRLTFDAPAGGAPAGDAPAGAGGSLTIHVVPLDRGVAVLGVHAYDPAPETRQRPPPADRLGIVRSHALVGTAAAGVRIGLRAAGQNALGQDAPGRDAPGQNAPGQNEPGRDAPGRDAPGRDALGQDAPAQDAPGRDAIARHVMVNPLTGVARLRPVRIAAAEGAP